MATFIVRIVEIGGAPPGELRGEVAGVGTGTTTAFRSGSELLEILQRSVTGDGAIDLRGDRSQTRGERSRE